MKNVVSFILAISFLTTATFADGVTTLAGSEWGEGQDSRVVIQFAANGKVSGNLGCNRFFGTYKRTGAKLSFSRVASTKMACPEPMMATEARISSALSATAQADASHLKLVLRDAEGKELLILRRRDFD